MRAGAPKSGLWTCMVSPSPTELAPQPHIVLIQGVKFLEVKLRPSSIKHLTTHKSGHPALVWPCTTSCGGFTAHNGLWKHTLHSEGSYCSVTESLRSSCQQHRVAMQTVWDDSPTEAPSSTPVQGPMASEEVLPLIQHAPLHLHSHLSVTRNPFEKYKGEKLLDPPQTQFIGVCKLQASCTVGDKSVNFAYMMCLKLCSTHLA